MIDGQERNAQGVAESLCAGHADQQRTDEARARGHGDLFDVTPSGTDVGQRSADERKEVLQMLA